MNDEREERAGDLLTIELSAAERRLLTRSLNHWLGPMTVTEELTTVLGYPGRDAFYVAERQLWPRLVRGDALTRAEWLAVLVAAELAFASAVYRGAQDFEPCTGISDLDGLRLLRAVQRKIFPHVGSIVGAGVGTTRRREYDRPRFRRVDEYEWTDHRPELGELPELTAGHRVIAFTCAEPDVVSVGAPATTPALLDLGVVSGPADLGPLAPSVPHSSFVRKEVWIFAAAATVPTFDEWRPLFEREAVTFADAEREFPDPPATWPRARVEAQRSWLMHCQTRLREALAHYRPLTYVGAEMVVTRDRVARAAIETLISQRWPHDPSALPVEDEVAEEPDEVAAPVGEEAPEESAPDPERSEP